MLGRIRWCITNIYCSIFAVIISNFITDIGSITENINGHEFSAEFVEYFPINDCLFEGLLTSTICVSFVAVCEFVVPLLASIIRLISGSFGYQIIMV